MREIISENPCVREWLQKVMLRIFRSCEQKLDNIIVKRFTDEIKNDSLSRTGNFGWDA